MKIPENRKLNFILLVCIAANVLVGLRLYEASIHRAGYYFLDVGQGDSELVILPDNHGNEIKILIDGGRDKRVMRELGAVLGNDRRIDLVMMTHPQLDHFGGLIDVIQQYNIGAFITSGRRGEIAAFHELEDVLRVRQIKTIIVKEGDRMRYGKNTAEILSPSLKDAASKELNDASLVLLIASENVRALYTGDAGEKIEKRLLKTYNISADILKVGHHGSRFSSTASFLDAVNPKVAVIEVGKNTYGHPTIQTLKRLKATGAKIYRTDIDKAIRISTDDKKLMITKKQAYYYE